MQVVAPFFQGFVLLDGYSIFVGVGVLPDAGYLPGDFHAGLSAGNLETLIRYLFRNVNRCKTTNAGELIAEILVPASRQRGSIFKQSINNYHLKS